MPLLFRPFEIYRSSFEIIEALQLRLVGNKVSPLKTNRKLESFLSDTYFFILYYLCLQYCKRSDRQPNQDLNMPATIFAFAKFGLHLRSLKSFPLISESFDFWMQIQLRWTRFFKKWLKNSGVFGPKSYRNSHNIGFDSKKIWFKIRLFNAHFFRKVFMRQITPSEKNLKLILCKKFSKLSTQFLPPKFLPPKLSTQFLPPQFLLSTQFLPPKFTQFLPPSVFTPKISTDFLPPTQFLPPKFLPPEYSIKSKIHFWCI